MSLMVCSCTCSGNFMRTWWLAFFFPKVVTFNAYALHMILIQITNYTCKFRQCQTYMYNESSLAMLCMVLEFMVHSRSVNCVAAFILCPLSF